LLWLERECRHLRSAQREQQQLLQHWRTVSQQVYSAFRQQMVAELNDVSSSRAALGLNGSSSSGHVSVNDANLFSIDQAQIDTLMQQLSHPSIFEDLDVAKVCE
jgi:hypothetical protein